MQKKLFVLIGFVLGVTACHNQNHQSANKNDESALFEQKIIKNAEEAHDLKALATQLHQDDGNDQEPEIKPIITKDGKVKIDWSLVDTKQPILDTKTYEYPIALETEAVKNYAKAYNITNKQAQHSIVVGMAAPEALGKILDQLQGKYLGHYLTDGANMSLVINTTNDVIPQKHDYVFADNFGKGLVLPVVIEPKHSTK